MPLGMATPKPREHFIHPFGVHDSDPEEGNFSDTGNTGELASSGVTAMPLSNSLDRSRTLAATTSDSVPIVEEESTLRARAASLVEANIQAAEALGIKGIHVVNKDTVPEYFRTYDFNAEVE